MLSNVLELLGFTCLTGAAYEYSGRALALLVVAGACFTMGLAAENVHPLMWLRAHSSRRWQSLRARRRSA